jgi:hypothetical protein
MTINFFDNQETKVYIEKPFVEEYAKDNALDVSEYPVTGIKKTRKGNGYLIETDSFLIFLFNRNKVLEHLLEAMSVYIKTGHGYQIIVVLQPNDPYYKIGVDTNKPTNWLLSGGKYFPVDLTGSSLDQQDSDINPFLPPPISGTRHKRATPSNSQKTT